MDTVRLRKRDGTGPNPNCPYKMKGGITMKKDIDGMVGSKMSMKPMPKTEKNVLDKWEAEGAKIAKEKMNLKVAKKKW